MRRLQPESKRTYPRFPYPTPFRSTIRPNAGFGRRKGRMPAGAGVFGSVASAQARMCKHQARFAVFVGKLDRDFTGFPFIPCEGKQMGRPNPRNAFSPARTHL